MTDRLISPLDNPCPKCLARPGDLCVAPGGPSWVVPMHVERHGLELATSEPEPRGEAVALLATSLALLIALAVFVGFTLPAADAVFVTLLAVISTSLASLGAYTFGGEA